MKTYKKTIEKPCLEIWNDELTESPREWSNLGYFITIDRDYQSPDKHKQLENIIKNSGEVAKNQNKHIDLIKQNYNCSEDKIVAIYPIVKYEHGGVIYSLGEKHGFDYSNNGFYIITEKTQKEMGTKKKDFEKVAMQEIEIYNNWINGEVYGFTLYNEEGEEIDKCGGIYEIKEIKEFLPEEYQNEDLSEYLID